MKIITYNVNGIRSVLNKGFMEWLQAENPDVICLQEIKAQKEQIDIFAFEELGYQCYINSAEKKGYSGTAIFTKIPPLSVNLDFDNMLKAQTATQDSTQNIFTDTYGNANREGRLITLELPNFYLITAYVPNAKTDLSRLTFRHDIWDKKLLEYLKFLENKKPIILCGDLNVAHKEIDLANPKQNVKNAGFTPQEREGFDNYMENELTDLFRHFYPDKIQYTWWSMRSNARAKNIGWRIDYFIASNALVNKIKDIKILDEVTMSDH
ncbi:MAG: exodeoxyribonuclease III, partial [Bacteroidales bacterium]|nr:exodeoxyribonuclease III [Bacteroidales bacterium]